MKTKFGSTTLIVIATSVSLLFWISLGLIVSSRTAGPKYAYSGKPGKNDFVVFLTVSDFDDSNNATFVLTGIDFPIEPFESMTDDYEVCIESLTLATEDSPSTPLPNAVAMSRESLTDAQWIDFFGRYSSSYRAVLAWTEDDLCYSNWNSPARGYPTHGGSALVDYGEKLVEHRFPMEVVRDIYFYPYDKRIVAPKIELTATVKNGESEFQEVQMPVVMAVKIVDSQWDEKVTFVNNRDPSSNSDLLQMIIELSRPKPIQLLVGALALSMAAFVFLLNYIHDTGSFLEVAVGITLGLWGIQAAIKPQFITQDTIVDDAILVIYLLLVMAIIVRFVIEPIAARVLATDDSRGAISTEEEE